MKNLLYMSCHEILEYNEVRLFMELGFNVLSMGTYLMNNRGSGIRPPIEGLYQNLHLQTVAMNCSKENINEELLDWADIIIMDHNFRVDTIDHPQPWLGSTKKNSRGLTGSNWEKIKKSKKPCVWRSIGQSTKEIEESLKPFRDDGLKIVRYSPKEKNIPSYVGEDAMIRFNINSNEYIGHTGVTPQIVNISQAMFGSDTVNSRGSHMAKPVFDHVVGGLPWKIFGPDNENAEEHNGGLLSYEDLKTMLKINRAYLYTGTRPASYTLGFMEAMVSGIPIVSIGHKYGNELYNQDTFEIPEIIGESGVAGYWSDDPDELKKYCQLLLDTPDLAFEIGRKGRERAIELFDTNTIRQQWHDFFATLKEV
jgi:hypothetical protein